MGNRSPVPIIAAILIVFIAGGLWIDHQRDAQRATLTGYFEYRPTDISSRVTGRVVKLNVDEGDNAKAGDLLVQLDAAPQTQDALAKEAQASAAYSQLQEAKAGARPYDISRQEAIVAAAKATLEKLLHGALPEEKRESSAQVGAALADYNDAVIGPMPGELAKAKHNALLARNRWLQAVIQQNKGQITALKASLDSATANEAKVDADAKRMDSLTAIDAATKQQRDDADAALKVAQADLVTAQTNYTNAQNGSNPIAVDAAHNALQDSQTQVELLLADTRPGVVQERKEQLAQARAAQQLLLNGPRHEDIDIARAELDSAQSTLDELKAGTRPEDTNAAMEQWRAANESARSAISVASEYKVRAPFNCEIEHVLVADGDLVPAGTHLLRISDPSDIWLRVYVPESSLAKVNVGEKAVLTVDGIDGVVNAIVKSVATNGEFTPANLQSPEERGQQVYAVRLKLAQPDSRIKAGMAATVRSIGDWSP